MDYFFTFLNSIEEIIWNYFGVPATIFLGLFFTIHSKFFQIRKFPAVIRTFIAFLKVRETKKGSIHPLKAFFASVGGCVGVGNIVSICTAVQIGGPGALFWIWITSLLGGMLKYAEVYLGLRFRVPNAKGGYDGGPMYYLQRVFKRRWIPNTAAVLLCIYGVEIYQFNVVAESLAVNFEISFFWVALVLLVLVIFAGSGGVRRVGAISSAIIPLFMVIFVSMGFWVLFQNLGKIPSVLHEVFVGAFQGSAALGGFVGSTMARTVTEGVKRGCYSSDVGVGYASVIYSESSVKKIERQAALVLFDVFLDTFVICTTSVVLILLTGVWQQPMEASLLVQTALGQYFPYMHFFMPFFLFLLGYSTINAFFCVGLKSAEFISPIYGRKAFYAYAILMFIVFSSIGTQQAQALMTIAGGMLLLINCYGIFKLRNEISYDFNQKAAQASLPLS